MNYTELTIKSCYESGVDNIIEDFYEPVLSLSVKYDRIAGFFSSSSLAIASRGMANFIRNGGTMRLICSPILNEQDADIIKKIYEGQLFLSSEELGIKLNSIEDEFESNHVKALGWMLANNLLEIKLAVLKDENGDICTANQLSKNGIFHQKVGIMQDFDGNNLSFSGSINESATAWVNNDEEFKVFKEWMGMEEYYEKDKNRFDAIWKNQRNNVQTFDLPTAIKNDLIDYSKDFNGDSIAIKNYKKTKERRELLSKISLFPYQKEALLLWKKNDYNMLFEMATGTGKTRTAITGLNHLMSLCEKLIVIIACPQNTLSVQWMGELEKLNINGDKTEIIDGTNPKWHCTLGSLLAQNSAGFANHCIIYTTHKTASSSRFIEIIKEKRDKNVKTLFIGDEVHWLGASQYRKALLKEYDYRIGLSATPSRWFDDDGTRILESYFGNNHFEFTIKDALLNVNPITGKHFLVNYYYYINHVQLNEVETEQYKKLTSRIIALLSSKGNNSDNEYKFERLIEQRADIIKNAENKYDVFEDIIGKLKQEKNLNNLIIFVSPQQIEKVKEILANNNIIFHKLTQEEGTRKEAKYCNKSEREYIIQQFKTGNYQALIAIKCLDEGIDIPSASRGILMASSTNPREYVQRIGRIIRQDTNKQFAYLYDICVDSIDGDEECNTIEKKIRNKEQLRMKEIAENAINSVDALEHIIQFN